MKYLVPQQSNCLCTVTTSVHTFVRTIVLNIIECLRHKTCNHFLATWGQQSFGELRSYMTILCGIVAMSALFHTHYFAIRIK